MSSPWNIPELLVRRHVFHGPQLGIVLLPVTDVLLHIVDQFILETFEIRRTHGSRANRRQAQNTVELLLFIFFFDDYQHSPRFRNVIKLLVLQALWFFPWIFREQSTVTAVRAYSALPAAIVVYALHRFLVVILWRHTQGCNGEYMKVHSGPMGTNLEGERDFEFMKLPILVNIV